MGGKIMRAFPMILLMPRLFRHVRIILPLPPPDAH